MGSRHRRTARFAGYRGAVLTALLLDTNRGDFFKRYAQAASSRGTLRICFLRIAGRAIAMQFAVVQSRQHRSAFYFHGLHDEDNDERRDHEREDQVA